MLFQICSGGNSFCCFFLSFNLICLFGGLTEFGQLGFFVEKNPILGS